MVKKIISGGQTGVDRAALDFAMKFNIPHGGWIVRGRMAEDGVLPRAYKLQEIPETSYPRRTLKNVLESDGTLLVSRSPLTGGSEYTRKMATGRRRPLLHIDLSRTSQFGAAEKIRDWIDAEKIEVLNVAGPRASKDPKIYRAVFDILETAFFLDIIDSSVPEGPYALYDDFLDGELPETLEEAADALISGLSFSDRTKIANMSAERLGNLSRALGDEIATRFALGEDNPRLMESCLGGAEDGDESAAVESILRRASAKLRKKRNVLKVVK